MKEKLIKFFKYVGGLFLILVIIGIALAGYGYYHNSYQRNKVSISVAYDPDSLCTKEFPLAIHIHNKSIRTVIETRFEVEIKRKGYSNNLVASGLKPGKRLSYYNSQYETDKIIEPNGYHVSCWVVPELEYKHKDKYPANELLYNIGYHWVSFGK